MHGFWMDLPRQKMPICGMKIYSGRWQHSVTPKQHLRPSPLQARYAKAFRQQVLKSEKFRDLALNGKYSPASSTAPQPVKTGTPWLSLPPPPAHQKRAIIIGAGLAGACTAWSLVQRGWKVEVIDQHPEAAQAGSGNHQGALYAKLPAKPISSSQLHLQGFLHALNFLQSNIPAEGIWNQCGMLQLATTDKEKLRQEALVKENQYPEALIHAVDSSQASKIAGQDTPHSGLYIPDAGWVSPVRLCNYLLQHPDIHCRFNTRIDKISRHR